jgi:hypothetical protein
MPKPFNGEIKLDIRDSKPNWDAFLPGLIYIDDQVVGEQDIRTILSRYSLCGEGLCVGYDGGDASRASARRSSSSPAAESSRSCSMSPTTPIDVEQQVAAAIARD